MGIEQLLATHGWNSDIVIDRGKLGMCREMERKKSYSRLYIHRIEDSKKVISNDFLMLLQK